MNIQGINETKKFDRFKNFISITNRKYDIIILSETKLKKSFPHGIYNLNGYNKHICCRNATSSGGGLMVYTRKELLNIKIDTKTSGFERISINLKIDNKGYKLIAYYRAPGTANRKDFMKDLDNEIRNTDDNVMICGDINIDIKEENSLRQEYLNILKAYNIEIMNSIKTRNASGKIIDHFACNFFNKTPISNFTVHNELSDHNAIITCIDDVKSRRTQEFKCIKRTDYDKAKDVLINLISMSNLLKSEDPDIIANTLIEIMQKTITESTKSVRVKVKEKNIKCPWFNWTVLNALKKKSKIARRLRRTKRFKNKIRRLLRIESIKVNKIIEREKRKYFNIHMRNENPKTAWKKLNEMLGRRSKDKLSFINVSGTIITDELTIAQKINQFFVENIVNTVNDLTVNAKAIKFNSVRNSFVLHETDEEEVALIINRMKNSAAGYDNIFPRDVKKLSSELCPYLCHLINSIIRTGIFPSAFKLAIVTPVSKTGKLGDMNDLRPISILSAFNKIVEKFLYERIMQYLLKFNLLSKNQFGFRPKSNTEAAAMELVSTVRKSLDNKKIASVVFLDLKKAFDLVDRSILMKMVKLIGLRGKMAVILESYLSRRLQMVKIGNKLSDPLEIIFGVVQGSILGSLLFNIFINEICSIGGINGRIILYADDLALINEHDPKETVSEKITNDMRIILNFIHHQKMSVNISKTNFMIFNSPFIKTSQPDSIKIDENYTITKIHSMKYLGLYIDPQLKWDIHGENVEKKLSQASGIMWKLKKILPMSAKKRIYHSLFATHINYMLNIWGTACDNIIKPIQIIQNRMIRNLYGFDRRDNRSGMYMRVTHDNIIPIRAMNFLNTASFVYSCKRNLIHNNISFEVNVMERNLLNLRPAASRNSYGRKNIQHFGVNIYNQLPVRIKKAIHIHSFKSQVRQFMSTTEFLDICFDGRYLRTYG